MPFTGSAGAKTYARTNGVHGGATQWQQDEASAIGIRSDYHDVADQDIATAVNTALQKNGDNTLTANIPAGGFGFTGLGVLGSAAEVTVASASTADILGAAALFVLCSGTVTVTSLGTGTNRFKVVRFDGVLTLTYNATSLITPTAANITTAAGDTMGVVSDGSSNARVVWYQRASGNPLTIGKETIWIPAGAMTANTTNGPSAGSVEISTNTQPMVISKDFDTTTQEFCQFTIRMPKSWNEGTVSFAPRWSHAATNTNFGVVWGLDAVAVSDQDTMAAAFGTAQTSTDTGGTTNTSYEGPESSAITIAGTPAANDMVVFRIHRDPANGSDTMAIDARLQGIVLFYTIDTLNDS